MPSIPKLKTGEYRVREVRSMDGNPLYIIEGAAGIDPKTGATLIFTTGTIYGKRKDALKDLKRGYF